MNIKWQPHPKQEEALSRTEYEILYGGARGGGKTDAGMAFPLYNISHPKYRALVIRRNFDDLVDWTSRARDFYMGTGAEVVGGKEVRFPSGAVIRLGHLKDESAYTKYQGHEYHNILLEELTQIPQEELYLKLISSCRSTVPELRPQIFATTNPGEIGHARVKKRFIDVALPGVPYIDPITGRSRIFIPSRIEDNPTLMQNDPDYVRFLDGLPEDLRKAWREGDWNVFDTKGSFYSTYIMESRKAGRVCKGLYESALDIHKFRDLGLDDEMVIIVSQFYGKEIRIIDCLYGNNDGLDYYINLLKDKSYGINLNYYPHDIEVREHTNGGQTRKMYLEKLGVEVKKTPNISIEDGINLCRINFNKIWFDESKPGVQKLLEALNIYRRRRDDKNLVYGKPIHDWSSNFADAFRYMLVNYDKIIKEKIPQGYLTNGRTKINPVTGKPLGNSNNREEFLKRMGIKR